MKKLFFPLISLLCAVNLFAQIAPVQTAPKRYEYINVSSPYNKIIYDTQTKKYDLMIGSDNQFEKKVITLHLGKNEVQSIESFKNLKNAILQKDAEFVLDGQRYISNGARIFAQHMGVLEYAAGYYTVSVEDCQEGCARLFFACDTLPINEITITNKYMLNNGTLYVIIELPEYDAKTTGYVSIPNQKASAYFNTNEGYVWNDEDVKRCNQMYVDGVLKNEAFGHQFLKLICAKLVTTK